MPTYASACSGTVRYSSACSCFGVTKSTTTLSVSTMYETVIAPTPITTATAFTSITVVTGTETLTLEAQATIGPGPRPACGSTITPGGPCRCSYNVACGQKFLGGRVITTLAPSSELGCVLECDKFLDCINADYDRTTGVCRIFTVAEGTSVVPDSDGFAYTGVCDFNRPPGCN